MGIYRCREAFTFTDTHGVPRVITTGALVDSDDPDFAKRLAFFEPVEVAAARMSATETATSAPGEIRTVSSHPRRLRKRVEHSTAAPTTEEN